MQQLPLPKNSSSVINVTGVPVQGLYLKESLYKTAVTTSMVVDWVVLLLELRMNRMVLKDVHCVPLVSLYPSFDLVLQLFPHTK